MFPPLAGMGREEEGKADIISAVQFLNNDASPFPFYSKNNRKMQTGADCLSSYLYFLYL